MRTLKTSEAAALLNVAPNTLRTWERRFGYPKPQRSAGRHRLYAYAEIVALGEALREGLSISSAITFARDGNIADTRALVGALIPFREDRADSAMEATIALRSLERSVEEVLLPSLNEVRRRRGLTSTTWALASRWARDWLRRARQLTPPADAIRLSILLGDAAHPELDPAEPYVRALELLCVRGGARITCLPVHALEDLTETAAAVRPDAVVIAGSHAADDIVANWAYRVRSATGPGPVALFHRT